MIFVGSGASRKAAACATSHTLDLSMETSETSNKDAGGKWATYDAGILSWTATSESIFSVGENGLTYDDFVSLMIAREAVHLVMAAKNETADTVPTEGWTPKAGDGHEGDAFITSVSKNAPNGENATFTVNFTGTGALTPVKSEE